MAIPRGHRFPIEFDNAFPQGLVLIGDVAPDNEYQTCEDKAAGRPVRQKIDNVTGKRQWKPRSPTPTNPRGRDSRWSTLRLNDLESLPLVCYASGADVMGYPRHPVIPCPRAHFWDHPGAEARRRRLYLVGSWGS
jgi:hypothetical protein